MYVCASVAVYVGQDGSAVKLCVSGVEEGTDMMGLESLYGIGKMHLSQLMPDKKTAPVLACSK